MTSLAAIRTLLLTAALVSQGLPGRAAEPVETTCGVAYLRIEANFVRGAVLLAPTFCRNPAAFAANAASLLQRINQRIASFNARFAAAGCDPDLSLPVAAKTTADVMLVLQTDAGSTPLDRFCNGIDDPDTACGNDQDDPGEACDGSNLGGQTCESLANGTGTLGCAADCQSFDLSGCAGPPYCGNGRTEGAEQCDAAGPTATCDRDCTVPQCGDGDTNPFAGEQCDDGNLSDGDGCSSTCVFPDTTCGNGRDDAGETCDGSDLAGQTCASLANGTGMLGCVADCQSFDLSGCTGPLYCGNGRTEPQVGEQCDVGGRSATCDIDCTFPQCGDGETNPFAAEQCDDGNLINGDGCSNTCVFD